MRVEQCDKCQKRYSVTEIGGGMPGNKESEEISCPHCGYTYTERSNGTFQTSALHDENEGQAVEDQGSISPERQADIDDAMAILRCMNGREISTYFAAQKRFQERGEPIPPLPEIYRKRMEDRRAARLRFEEMSQKQAKAASSVPPAVTPAQRAWFNEFEAVTGGDAVGLGDLEAGLTTFAQAAKHSLACFRQESQEIADRLERELNPLIG